MSTTKKMSPTAWRKTKPKIAESFRIACEKLDDLTDELREHINDKLDERIVISRKPTHVNDKHTALAWWDPTEKIWRRDDHVDECYSTLDEMLQVS